MSLQRPSRKPNERHVLRLGTEAWGLQGWRCSPARQSRRELGSAGSLCVDRSLSREVATAKPTRPHGASKPAHACSGERTRLKECRLEPIGAKDEALSTSRAELMSSGPWPAECEAGERSLRCSLWQLPGSQLSASRPHPLP